MENMVNIGEHGKHGKTWGGVYWSWFVLQQVRYQLNLRFSISLTAFTFIAPNCAEL